MNLIILLTAALAVFSPARDEAVATQPDRETLVADCVRLLVETEENGGKWPYEGRYRIAGEIPVPYEVGGTSLVCLALLYAADTEDEAAAGAFDRGLAFVLDHLDHPQMVPEKELRYDMRVLGQAYALLLLSHVKKRQAAGAVAVRVDEWLPRLVEALVLEQMEDGGWNYQGRPVHSAFVTASVVQALLWAEAGGEKISRKVLSRARAALAASRFRDGGFYYFGTKKSKGKRDAQDLLQGSIGRSAICETMLYLLGDGSIKRVDRSVNAFYEHWDELEKRRQKPGTHEGPYLIAPYYFYYGHRYAAQAIELLPESSRPKERARLLERLLETRDADGTWNDRVFERSRRYATAMVLLALISERVGLPEKRRF